MSITKKLALRHLKQNKTRSVLTVLGITTTGFTMEVREVRLAAGAGFVVVICGSIMTMPGLPKKPAAVGIDVDADGKITGLF